MKHTTRQAKENFWREHVSRFESSGLNRREYCHQENISYWSLRDWQKKLNDRDDTQLVQLPAAIGNRSTTSLEYLELMISDKITVRVPENFNGSHLRRLIGELGVEL